MSLVDAARAAEVARSTAMAAGDLDALADLLHEDLRYGHASGLWDTKAEYLAKLAGGTLVYPAMTSTETGVLEADGLVLLWVEVDAEVITPAGQRHMHNASLTVWDVRGERPRMVAHQPTVLA
jgi:hypothetical protein